MTSGVIGPGGQILVLDSLQELRTGGRRINDHAQNFNRTRERHMRAPLWWIGLTTFTRVFVYGEPYFGIRAWRPTSAWFVAGVVYRACVQIRQVRPVRRGGGGR